MGRQDGGRSAGIAGRSSRACWMGQAGLLPAHQRWQGFDCPAVALAPTGRPTTCASGVATPPQPCLSTNLPSPPLPVHPVISPLPPVQRPQVRGVGGLQRHLRCGLRSRDLGQLLVRGGEDGGLHCSVAQQAGSVWQAGRPTARGRHVCAAKGTSSKPNLADGGGEDMRGGGAPCGQCTTAMCGSVCVGRTLHYARLAGVADGGRVPLQEPQLQVDLLEGCKGSAV